MEDRRMEVLTQYDLNIKHCGNLKGALVLETDCGRKVLRPSRSGEQRLEFEDAVKQYIKKTGELCVDTVCRTREGKLFSENSYGDRFCVRDWYYGEECSLKQEEHCFTAVDTLNRFQSLTTDFPLTEEYKLYEKYPLTEQFAKRTRELKRVRGYIREKKQKSDFEVYYLKLCDGYYEQALAAEAFYRETLFTGNRVTGGDTPSAGSASLASQTEAEQAKLIHGNFSYHSLLTDCPLGADCFVLTSFDKSGFGQQISDFYYLLRKTMEKNDWECALGLSMIQRYLCQKKNPDRELKLLKAQLLFPEKFWKITNYYYNNRKTWIPEKNIKKMFSNHDREPRKAEFIRAVF